MKAPRLLAGRRSPNWACWERFEIPNYDQPERNYLTRLRIIQTPWLGVYLHRLDGPDPRPTLHDHPWPFVALVLRGGYIERLRKWGEIEEEGICSGQYGPEARRRVRWVNVKRARDVHSIRELHRTPTWTLLFVGRRRRVWGYLDDDGTWQRFDEHPHNDEFTAAMAARKEMTSDGHS